MVPLLNFLIATAIGLLVGLERERSKGTGPLRAPAGIRTFALASLGGAAAMSLGGVAAVGLVMLLLSALVGIAYFRQPAGDPGLTTEVALVLMPLLGALSLGQPLLAGGLGVMVAVLLAAKPILNSFVQDRLTESEVRDGLLFAVVTLVVWPQLPDRGIGPYAAINPHTIWLVVILVLAIGGIGHVAGRMLGARYGLPASGLAGGFVSSVATIGAMGVKARAEPGMMAAAVAGATLSSVATFVQMALVLAAVSLPTLRAMVPALVAGGAAIILYGGLFARSAVPVAGADGAPAGRAFSLAAALVLAAAMAGILLLIAVVEPRLGKVGITMAAAIGGLLDAHAAAMSVAAQVADARLPAEGAVVPILAAMSANAAMKLAMAVTGGGARYALRVGGGVVAYIAAIWAAALFLA
jgi:uncharacterized membrane protein (DUF4010 family)